MRAISLTDVIAPLTEAWRAVKWAVIIGLIGIVFGGGWWLGLHSADRDLALASQQIGRLSDANQQMAGAVKSQNAAVDSLARAGEKMHAIADAVQLAADQANHRQQLAVTRILQSKPPPGVDPCLAAQLAFDTELRTERGQHD